MGRNANPGQAASLSPSLFSSHASFRVVIDRLSEEN